MVIPEVLLLRPRRFEDERGFFSETYQRDRFREAGIRCEFVQDNHARSAAAGTVRGLHYQVAPAAQDKLIRVVRGAIFDVVLDLRRGAPSFGRHVSAELSAGNWAQLFIPRGFAHGYCTLEPGTEVVYKVSTPYAPEHERGILWDDPALEIDWPQIADPGLLSEKDRRLPTFGEQPDLFDG